MTSGFVISASQIDGVCFVRLVGELDSAYAPRLERALGAAEGRVVVDCEALDFIDAHGINALVAVAERVESVQLVNVSPSLRKLLVLTGTDRMLLEP